MKDWLRYWNESEQVKSTDPLRQVGKTVRGMPVSAAQLDTITSEVRRHLGLDGSDMLLDLGCGNGVLTLSLASYCQRIVAVDFSVPLLETARERFNAANIEYVRADVSALPAEVLERRFDKVMMYEAIQHLDASQLDRLMLALSTMADPPKKILFGSIPDVQRIWNFYNTPALRDEYRRRVQTGTEAIGTWWHPDELSRIFLRHGYETIFQAQNPALHGVHYRFDALCTRQF